VVLFHAKDVVIRLEAGVSHVMMPIGQYAIHVKMMVVTATDVL
jgi:hypothetical protein